MLENYRSQEPASSRTEGRLGQVLEIQEAVRVLLADDSSLIRTILRNALTSPAPGLPAQSTCRVEICGMARDGVECLEAVRNLKPDLVILDIEMPRMDGLTALSQLKSIAPNMPVIMFSALTAQGARATLDALARGAADYVTKPSQQRDLNSTVASLQQQLLPKIAGLTRASRKKSRIPNAPLVAVKPELLGRSTQMAALPARLTPVEAVLIGISTGGPSALEKLLPTLPADFPVPILIVQHMPAIFTEMLAQRLNANCKLKVREAVEGEIVVPGNIWIAKGDWHMKVKRRSGSKDVQICLDQAAPENYSRPAVDVLFRSAVEVYGAATLGVVMTGMGSDGAAGALAMQRKGGTVIAQDEASCAVWGMPLRAIETGAVYKCTNVEGIATELLRRVMNTEVKHAV